MELKDKSGEIKTIHYYNTRTTPGFWPGRFFSCPVKAGEARSHTPRLNQHNKCISMNNRHLIASLTLTACLIGCGKKTTTTTETEGNPPAATQPQAASSNQAKPDPVYRVAPPVDQ